MSNIVLQRIIETMNEQNVTQRKLTKALNITERSFGSWKSGRNLSYLKYLHAIANYPATPAIDESPHFCGLFALLSHLWAFCVL